MVIDVARANPIAFSSSWPSVVSAVLPTAKKTFGYYRLEILAAFVNGTTALESAAKVLRTTAPLVTEPNAHAYVEQLSGAACAALGRLDSGC